MNHQRLAQEIEKAIDAWVRWLPKWNPPRLKTGNRICRRCTGSPIRDAAGFQGDVPHQVVHSLINRMHRIIDREVDVFTRHHLPVLQNELENQELWKNNSYNSQEGLPEEVAGLEVDIVVEEGDHPVLFTFAELEESSTAEQAPLPLPPLNNDEKQQLKKEMHLADQHANKIGEELCFLLASHRTQLAEMVDLHVEPKIQMLLADLSKSLETPTL